MSWENFWFRWTKTHGLPNDFAATLRMFDAWRGRWQNLYDSRDRENA